MFCEPESNILGGDTGKSPANPAQSETPAVWKLHAGASEDPVCRSSAVCEPALCLPCSLSGGPMSYKASRRRQLRGTPTRLTPSGHRAGSPVPGTRRCATNSPQPQEAEIHHSAAWCDGRTALGQLCTPSEKALEGACLFNAYPEARGRRGYAASPPSFWSRNYPEALLEGNPREQVAMFPPVKWSAINPEPTTATTSQRDPQQFGCESSP